MRGAKDSSLTVLPEYRRFIEDLKTRVVSARISAVRSVNRELILLYWDIGRAIVEKQKTLGWGESVVEMVAADLKKAFPGVTGFSAQNVWRMVQFCQTYEDNEFLAQVVREMSKGGKAVPKGEKLPQVVREMVSAVPWGHHANVLAKVTDHAARLYYLRATARFGWSRNVLLNQIKAGAYERAVTDKKASNFGLALPEHLAEQADEMLKSSYNLCAEKDDVEVEYALKTKQNPIGVAAYRLRARLPAELKGRLPTARQLADVVRAAMPSASQQL